MEFIHGLPHLSVEMLLHPEFVWHLVSAPQAPGAGGGGAWWSALKPSQGTQCPWSSGKVILFKTGVLSRSNTNINPQRQPACSYFQD